MDFRSSRVGVDRLETDPELSYLRQIFGFGSFSDTAHPSDIPLIEKTAVMGNFQPVIEKAEEYSGSARILRILKKLENEMGSICVQSAQKGQVACPLTVLTDIVLSYPVIVSRHWRFPRKHESHHTQQDRRRCPLSPKRCPALGFVLRSPPLRRQFETDAFFVSSRWSLG